MEPKVIPLMTVVLLTGLSSREKTGTKTEGREAMEKKDEWLCVGKGLNRCDVTSDFILGIWGASVNIYEHEHRF